MKFLIIYWIIFIILRVKSVLSINCNTVPINIESQLKKKLFCDRYDPLVRPINNNSNTTIVNLSLALKNFEFYETVQRLDAHTWLPMSYKDENLMWSPEQYNNIKYIFVSSQMLWKPNLYLYNSNNAQSSSMCSQAECSVDFTGIVHCVLPCSMNGLCEANFKLWPFDRHNCTLTIGTWLTTGDLVDYNITNRMSAISSHVLKHNEWNIISTSFTRDPGFISNLSYPNGRFNIIIERHSEKHIAIILIPALVMVIINLISLTMDLKSFERILLNAMNLLIHFGYIQQISWYIPRNGTNCPNIVLYFRDSLLITSIILTITITLRSISKYRTKLPMWLDTLNHLIIALPGLGNIFIIEMPILKEINDESNNLINSNDLRVGDTLKWMQFTKIIDRFMLIGITLTYMILILLLIPSDYGNPIIGDKISVTS